MNKVIGIIGAMTAAAAVGLLLLTGTASAHAPYASSTPAAGAVLSVSPSSVVINFQANIQSTSGSYGVTVTMDGGGSVTSGPATASSAAQLTVPLQTPLATGRYVVNWNDTAADDGDTLSGAFSFYMNEQPSAAQLAADQALAGIEAGQLATATAETILQATETAAAGAAAPTAAATNPTAAPKAAPTVAPSSGAAAPSSSAALPRTGTGPSGRSNNAAWLGLLVGLAGLGIGMMVFSYARRRAR